MSSAPSVDRILQVHTRYRHAGGEDQVVESERALLKGAGIEVDQVVFDNADIHESRSPIGDLRLAASAIWSVGARERVARAIARARPSVVHVHNTFAAASPSVYFAAGRAGIPVVQTLHNYRLVCPVATAFRDGHACTDCVGRAIAWPGVYHACVRGSRAQSAVVASMLAMHRALGTYQRRIDAYVALTSFQKGVMVAGGLPEERIIVIPNFLDPDPGHTDDARDGVVYVGRLSIEKGIETLVRAAAREPGVVRVAGDGPLTSSVEKAAASGDLIALGRLGHSGVVRHLRTAVALVLPSVWFEGFPMAVLEAFATGTPVIASRIGSLAEIIEDGVTGLLVDPADDEALASSIRWATLHRGEMGRMGLTARSQYEMRYRGHSHLAALLETYRSVRRSERTHA